MYTPDLNSMYQQYGVDPSGKKRAQELSAAITRQQFNDYQTRFMPYLEQLNSMVSPDAVRQQQQAWTKQVLGQQKDQIQQGFGLSQRNLSRYGAAIDPRVQAAGMRQSQLDAAANAAAQINSGNQQIKDRGMVLMSGQKC